VQADNEIFAAANALPSGGGASGGSVGVGASVALNTILSESEASLGKNASLSGATSLSVLAHSEVDTQALAQAGASGGTAVDGVVAVGILSETTTATVASGSGLTVGGEVTVSADSSGDNSAIASGTVSSSSGGSGSGGSGGGGSSGGGSGGGGSGGGVGVGGSVALITGVGVVPSAHAANGGPSATTPVTSLTSAELDRDVDTTGDLKVTAASGRTYTAQATAMAGGGSSNTTTAKGGNSLNSDTLNSAPAQDAQNKEQSGLSSNGGGSSGGKLSVAAALGAVIVGDTVSATIAGSASDPRSLTVGGNLLVSATGAVTAQSLGDGATTGKQDTGIGIGAALTILLNGTNASIGDSVHVVTPGTVTIQAVSSENKGLGGLAAEAMSGASGKKLAVAGSLAIGLSESTTNASVGDHFVVDRSGDAVSRAGAVSVTADNTSQLEVKAWAGSYSSDGNGFGASIAAVISLDTYSATVGDFANITAASLNVGATNERVDDIFTTLNTLVSAGSATLSTVNAQLSDSLSAVKALAGKVNSVAGAKDAASQAKGDFASQIATDKKQILDSLSAMGKLAMDLPLLGQNNYYTEVIAGSASGDKLALSGGFALQVLTNKSFATIGDGAHVDLTGALHVNAADNTVSRTIVGAASGSSGSSAAGISLGIIVNSGQVQSQIGANASLARSSAMTVGAIAAQDIDLFELSAAAADANGVAGILGVVTSLMNVSATTGAGGDFHSAGAVGVAASDTINILNLAGAVAAGGNNGIGGVAVATTIKDSATATLDSNAARATQVNADSLSVGASTAESLINVGVAGTAGGENSISGVASPLTQIVSASASIGAGANVTTTGATSVNAADRTQVVNVGGAFGAAGNNAVGGTIAVTSLINTITAQIGDGASVVAGGIGVSATGAQTALNVAVAGTAGGDNAVAGVITPVTQVLNVFATVGNGDALQANAGSVVVAASDSTSLINVGGALAVGGSNGVGGSAAVGTLSDTIKATVGDNTNLDATGAIQVTANATETVSDDVVSGSAGGDVGVSVALASSIVLDTVQASIGHADKIGTVLRPSSAQVTANDDTGIVDIAGTISAGSSAGVGAGADVVVLTKNTYAWIGRDTATETLGVADGVTALINGGDALVKATSSENVNSIVAGFAAGGDAGVAGSASIYVLTGSTLAEIGAHSAVTATGNVGVLAYDSNTLNRLVGSGAVGGTAGVGGAVGVSVAVQTTIADIGDDANVVGLGLSGPLDVTTGVQGSFSAYSADRLSVKPSTSSFTTTAVGDIDAVSVADAVNEGGALFTLSRTTTPIVTQVKGVAVAASATNLIRSLSVSGSVAGTAAISISGDLPVVISDTEARIGANAQINVDPHVATGVGQSVVVAASSDLYHVGLAGSVAVGGSAGVGAGAEATIFGNTTIASIGAGSTVNAASDVAVTALASENFASSAVSVGAGGSVGVAGGLTGFGLSDTTKASIESSSASPTTVTAGGNVVVDADDETRAIVTAGSLAVGGDGGVGIGVGISVAIKDTEATIGQNANITALGNGTGAGFNEYTGADFTTQTSGRGLLVQANSGESVFAAVIAGAGGFYAGVAGAISVEVFVDKTLATIGAGDAINQNNAGANAAQDVVVTARDSTVISASEGTVAVGIAAVGGAADVAVITNSTNASIGDGAHVTAARNVIVDALANRQTDSTVASIAGGIGGLSAAISVLAVANGPGSDQTSQLDNGNSGSFNASADSKLQDNSIDSAFLSQSTNPHVKAASAQAQTYKGSVSITDAEQSTVVAGNNARIGSATVTAGREADVRAIDVVNAKVTDGAVLAGAGLGAGIGIVAVTVTNAATVAPGAHITAGSADVAAQSDRTFNGKGIAATAVGVAAALVSLTDTTTTHAYMDGASLTTAGAANVSATASDTVTTATATLAGGVAGGLELIILTPTTQARIGANAQVNVAQSRAGDLTVTAENTITIGSGTIGVSVAGGGGVGATIVVETPTALAQIGDGATVIAGVLAPSTVIGDVVVTATTTESLDSVGAGVSLGDGIGGALTVAVRTETTTAEIGDATLTATGNVGVFANSTNSDNFAVGGAGVGAAAGIGGSIGVSVLTSTTTAEIDANANVTADALGSALTFTSGYNAAFSAYGSSDTIKAASLTGVSSAGSNPQVPVNTTDVTNAGEELLLQKRNEVAVTGAARGVVVNATKSDIVRSIAVSGGVAGLVGASLSANVPVLSDTTTASIGANAAINQRNAVSAGHGQSVVVAAANDLYNLAIIGAVSGGGAAGAGASIAAVVVDNHTNASIGADALVNARDDVAVSALAREDFATISAAGSAGGVGALAGGLSFLSLTDHTKALIDQGAHVVADNNVSVVADDLTRVATFDGALSASFGGALGAAVSVADVQKTTQAEIAANAQVTGLAQGSDTFGELTGADAVTTASGKGVLVKALSDESFFTVALAAGAAGGIGAAGAISVQVVNTTTLATIDGGATINGVSGGSGAQDVSVAASDITGMVSLDGAIAGSLIGALSGGVDIGVISSTTGASIGDATVNAGGKVAVISVADKELGSTVVSAAASGAALAAGISVYTIGNGVDPNSKAGQELQTSDSSGSVSNFAGNKVSTGGTVATMVDKTSSNSNARDAAAKVSSKTGSVNVTHSVQNAAVGGTSATIGSATINAKGAVNVGALDLVNNHAKTGAVAAGGVGIGAGIAIFADSATTTASVTGSSTMTVGSMSVSANMTHTVNETAYAGALALLVAAEADVAVATDTSTASASVSGVTVIDHGAFNLSATSNRTDTVSAAGAAVAIGAGVGVSSATAEIEGGVSATLDQGATIGQTGALAGAVSVTAESTDSAMATTLSAAGGLGGAGQGAVSIANVTPFVTLTLDNATIDSSAAITLLAQANDSANASSKGLALAGGLAVGASVANALVGADVQLILTDHSNLTAASLQADANAFSGGATAFATGASGAFVGINATSSEADDHSSAIAAADHSTIATTGALNFDAASRSNNSSTASGDDFGVVAVGANIANVDTNVTTRATFLDMPNISAGSLKLDANGTVSSGAYATAGSGGVVAGAASSASTSDTSTTVASLGVDAQGSASTIDVSSGAVTILATHTDNFQGAVDSTQAALVGASGARLSQSVFSTVSAQIGDHVTMDALNLTLNAQNIAHRYFIGEPGFNLAPGGVAKFGGFNPDEAGWDVKSGSGGFVDAPAATGASSVTLHTIANVGASSIHLLAPASGVGAAFIQAYNEAIVHQKTQVDSGGAIAVASGDAYVTVNATATVNFAPKSVVLVDVGDVVAAAWGNADIDARAEVTTYGLAGAPSGQAYANVTFNNILSVGKDARIEATNGIEPTNVSAVPTNGTVTLAAGELNAGVVASYAINTNVDLYNNTAIPIPTPPDARSNLTSNANVFIDVSDPAPTSGTNPHYGVNAAGTITVAATQGAMSTQAHGVGTNIYLEALSEIGSAISEFFGGGAVSFNITGGSTQQNGSSGLVIDGLVDTSIQRSKILTLNYTSSACDTSASACLATPVAGEIPYATSGPYAVGQTILDRIGQLRQLEQQYSSDPIAVAGYKSEENFLDRELVGLGLGSYDPSGNFVLASGATIGTPSTSSAQNLASLNTGLQNFQSAVDTNTTRVVDGYLDQILLTWNATDSNGVANSAFLPHAVTTDAASALSSYAAFSNYNAAFNANTGGIKTSVGDVTNQINAGNQAATRAVSDLTTSDIKANDIAAQVTNIVNAELDLASGKISESTASSQVSGAMNTIATDQTSVVSNNADIRSQTGIIAGAIAALRSDFANIETNATGHDSKGTIDSGDSARIQTLHLGESSGTYTPNGNNYISQLIGAQNFVTTTNSSLSTENNSYATAVSQLQNGSSTGGTINGPNTLAQWSNVLNNAAATANGTASTSGSTGAQSFHVAASAKEVSGNPVAIPVVVRIGNINLVGGSVATHGSGILSAPADGSISIVNNTANTLELNSLVIPSYDAGHVRVNGVLVNSAADIDSATGVASHFGSHAITTAANSGPSTVTITSNYNPQDPTYNSSSNSIPALRTPHVAPDIILNNNQFISNLNGSVSIVSAAGNIYIQGSINAGSLSIVARNGDLVTSFVNDFVHVGGDPASNLPLGAGMIANGDIYLAARYLNINSTVQSGIVDQTLSVSPSSLLYTTNAASVGLLQSAIDTQVNNYKNAATRPAISTADEGNGVTLDLTTGDLEFTVQTAIADKFSGNFSFLPSSLTSVGASYSIANNQIVVDATTIHGGLIQIYGQIMNTSSGGAGKLNVLDGFGTINITNTTSIPVVLSSLSTGADPAGTGRGTRGEIDILDVHLDGLANPSSAHPNQVDATYTVYTRNFDPANPSTAKVNILQETGIIDPQTANFVDQSGPSNTQGGTRSAVYNPLSGERYVWTTGKDYTATTNFQITGTQLFGSQDLTVANISQLTRTSQQLTSSGRLADGTYVTDYTTQNSSSIVSNSVNGVLIANSPSVICNTSSNCSVTANTAENTPLIASTFDYLVPNTNKLDSKGQSPRSCNWWTLCIVSDVTYYYQLTQKYVEISTNSVKADYPIAVNFIGSDTGSITVNSTSNVLLTGAISNVAGATSITATNGASIVQASAGATITSHNITLTADGSVGGVPVTPSSPLALPVAVSLTNRSVPTQERFVSASARAGSVSLTSASDLPVKTITAYGDVTRGQGAVTLVAGTNISPADSGALIQADRVSLNAANGSIGSVAGGVALTVDTGFTTDQALRPFGDPATSTTALNWNYGLSAQAAGDINITSLGWTAPSVNGKAQGNADGTILVNSIVSTGGNILLTTPGQVLDNNPVQQINQRTYNELLNYWNSLGLTGASAATRAAATVAAFVQSQTQQYRQYWQIRLTQPDGGAVYNPNFTVSYAPTSSEYKALQTYYTAQETAKNGGVAPANLTTLVANDISAYAVSQTAEYHTLNAAVGSFTTTYDDHFKYSGPIPTDLTKGAEWSETALGFSLSAGALKTITDTNPVIKAPNVSGRNVTIDAARGIGETITLANAAAPGVTIYPTLTPASSLTDDQKVALAAAEQSDLVLTVGVVALPANPTAEQIAAYNNALALGITNASTPIPLGEQIADMTPAQQAALKAAALGLTNGPPGFKGTYLSVLTKRPLNVAASGQLNLDVTTSPTTGLLDIGAAYVASAGSLQLGGVSVKGETRIKVLGSIGAYSAASFITTGNIVLEAASGVIGTPSSSTTSIEPTAPLVLNLLHAATITARAQNGVDILEEDLPAGGASNDANVDTIFSPNTVTLEAKGSIFNAEGGKLINILGQTVTLTADAGSIGTAANTLNVGVTPGGAITAAAAFGAVDLYGPGGVSFNIGSVTAGTTTHLTAAVDGLIEGPVQSVGDATLVAGGNLVFGKAGSVTTSAGDVSIDADSLQMLNGATAVATTGAVIVATTNDALVTGLFAGSSAADAVSITAGGHILAATDPARAYDISALSPGAGVKLRAGLGIGDETEADDVAVTPPSVTPGANPLIIRTNALDVASTAGNVDLTTTTAIGDATVTAAAGSIDIQANQNFTATLLQATQGNVVLNGAANLSVTSIVATSGPGNANGQITIDANAGSILLGNTTSGGTTTVQASGAVAFAGLTSTGGDIDVTSTGSTIVGQRVTTPDAATFNAYGDIIGQNAQVGSLQLNSQTGNIQWTTVNATGTFGAEATAGSILLGNTTSGGTTTVKASGAVAFTGLTSTGADITVTSTGSTIAGQTVTTPDAATFNAYGEITGQTAQVGSLQLNSQTGNIQWTTVNATGTFGAEATAGSIALGDTTSGGASNIRAAGSVAFTGLTSTGGDITVTSTGSTIAGQTVTTPDAATFNAYGDITGQNAQVGSLQLNSQTGNIQWTTVNATGAFGAEATAGSILLGNTTSGGATTVKASGLVAFTGLTSTGGDITVTSTGSTIAGQTVTTPDAATFNAYGDITGQNAQVGSLQLNSQTGNIQWTTVNATGTFGAEATAGSILLGNTTSGGATTVKASGSVAFTSLTSTGADITVTSTGSTIAGQTVTTPDAATFNAYGNITGQNAQVGSLQLTSQTGDINWTTVDATGTFGAEATAGSILLGNTTSGGATNVRAAGSVAFTSLTSTGADITVTSTGSTIAGQTVTTPNAATFNAFGNITGQNAQVGSLQLNSQTGDIQWTTVNATGAFGANATAGSILLGNTTSGGATNVRAFGSVAFTSLTSTGGDIDVTSTHSIIAGQTVTTPDAATLDAYGNITGQNAQVGSLVLDSLTGAINWNSVNAATTFEAFAPQGRITLGNTSSGGTTLIYGDGIDFNTINAVGGLTLTSLADIVGKSFTTLGDATVNSAGNTTLGDANARQLSITTPGSVFFNNLTVLTAVDFASGNLTIGYLRQAPGIRSPLVMTLTGYKGGMGTSAKLFVDAPNGLDILKLNEANASIITTAASVEIDSAIIDHTLFLETPFMTVWDNNWSPAPVLGYGEQLYQPGKAFFLGQNVFALNTNSYVVQYGPMAQVHDEIRGVYYLGSSFVRDFDRQGIPGDVGPVYRWEDVDPLTGTIFPIDAFSDRLEKLRRSRIRTESSGPAVNIGPIRILARQSANGFDLSLIRD
jgi:hypothetical protein